MIILYYSRGSPFPALLASLKHCRPLLISGQAWAAAAAWLQEEGYPGKRPFLGRHFGESATGETIYLASTAAPAPLLHRTLRGLGELTGSGDRVLPALYPLPWKRRWEHDCSAGRREACWREIEAFVERTRLQARLQESLTGKRWRR